MFVLNADRTILINNAWLRTTNRSAIQNFIKQEDIWIEIADFSRLKLFLVFLDRGTINDFSSKIETV